MSRVGWAIVFVAGVAGARPHRVAGVVREPDFPLRVLLEQRGERWANCVFAVEPIGEKLQTSPAVRDSFSPQDPLWGRCFLPGKTGQNHAGELIDVITVDGKRAWEQAYDRAVPPEAQSRLVPYGEVLRTLLAGLKPGVHRIRVDGSLRRGGRLLRLYTGDFGYVR